MKSSFIEDEFEFIGYACKVCFSNIGQRSGYICIPNDHPLRFKSEADVDYALVCHGGITFLEDKLFGVPAPDGGIWAGFDCTHLGDGMDCESLDEYIKKGLLDKPYDYFPSKGIIWTLDMVKEQLRRLARQLEYIKCYDGKLEWKDTDV